MSMFTTDCGMQHEPLCVPSMSIEHTHRKLEKKLKNTNLF